MNPIEPPEDIYVRVSRNERDIRLLAIAVVFAVVFSIFSMMGFVKTAKPTVSPLESAREIIINRPNTMLPY